MEKQDLRGRVAVVTGGSSGIGAACVRSLAAQGASIVIGFNQGAQRAEALMKELPGSGHATLQIPLVAPDGNQGLAERVLQQVKRVDILVNSAGFTKRIAHTDLETLTPEFFNSVLQANVGGPYAITRALLPILRQSDDALVVNISSVSAFTGSGSNIAYCASKAALDTMTMSLARAFGPVRFVCVSPASVDTGFVEGRTREEVQKKALQTPLGRVVTAEDVAQVVTACATQLKAATGTRIVMDGGHRL